MLPHTCNQITTLVPSIFCRRAIAAKLETLGGKFSNFQCCCLPSYSEQSICGYMVFVISKIFKNAPIFVHSDFHSSKNLFQTMNVKLEYWSVCFESFQESREENMLQSSFIPKIFQISSCKLKMPSLKRYALLMLLI